MSEKAEAVEGPDVNGDLTLMDAYYIGTRIQYLASCGPARKSISVVSDTDDDLVSCLGFLADRGEELDAPETLVHETRDFADHLSGYVDADTLTEGDAVRAVDMSRRWAEVFADKVAEIAVIHVQNSGFFDVERAMRDPEEFFDPGVWGWLKDESKRDLREAIRALATGCPTASVMVSLRAVERQLREWHNQRSTEDIKLGPWGHVLGELADLYDDHEKERPEVLTDLSYMKDRRNEVNHMESSPTFREAEINLRRVQATLESIHTEVEG